MGVLVPEDLLERLNRIAASEGRELLTEVPEPEPDEMRDIWLLKLINSVLHPAHVASVMGIFVIVHPEVAQMLCNNIGDPEDTPDDRGTFKVYKGLLHVLVDV